MDNQEYDEDGELVDHNDVDIIDHEQEYLDQNDNCDQEDDE